MKLSDYVADFIVKQGVKDVFLISGGGMMHLLDSIGKNKNLNVICNLNEQASSICADSYGQFTNNLGVCILTTGPGGTNAITGITASFLDSTPVLAISGQCKTDDFASKRNVRQFGAQEVEIAEMVRPVTKYAVKITNAADIRYHLEKAVFLACSGRKGPVWIDIPLDIQCAQIIPERLHAFDPVEENMTTCERNINGQTEHVYDLLNACSRPVFLIGGGVVLSGAGKRFRSLAKIINIPVLSTWRAKDIFTDDESIYFSSPGIPALRYANYILQNCDLLIIIGTRLNSALTAYNEQHFAYQAKKVIVDIDVNEINKLNMYFDEKIYADAGQFINDMLDKTSLFSDKSYSNWFNFCNKMREKYPLEREKQSYNIDGQSVDPYDFSAVLSEYFTASDIFIGSSSGRTCGISHMAIKLKQGQRFISHMGLGSMGFTLPSAIASCIAGDKRRTIALEGDGSLQHNIQELQLISNYKLPIKLFILNNSGYASIYMMQKNNFSDNFVACCEENNLIFPDLKDVADTYKLDYYHIENNNQVNDVVKNIMKDNRPVLCEIICSIYFDEIPKSKTIAHADGTFSSSQLENLYPFLPEKEVQGNMPVWDDKK
ncbi:thiamine pyrophosphate-binding protein [Pectinatus frisingensis]|uniref:thiamine pyrophosphate-binding protein n=1 Tax=Pectinatus frisingensis TaxID=865 RepID=UPI0018C4E72A|nr:thiamine pyrophosphate-binding protein [Pectinatus frisingensis]